MKARVVMIAVLVVLALVPLGVARAAPLVDGDPPLTQDIVDRTCNFFEWALDMQMTGDQRDRARDTLTTAWRGHDTATIATIAEIIQLQQQLAAAAPDKRAAAQQAVQTKLLSNLRAQPNSPAAHWLLSLYDAGHTPIIAGTPPLTQQMVDAYVELIGFAIGQARKGEAVTIDRKTHDALQANLVAAWKQSDAAQRQQLTQIPGYWAAIRQQWAQTPEKARAEYRKQWATAFGPPSSAVMKARTPAELTTAYALELYKIKTMHDITMRAMAPNGWHYEYVWQ